MDELTIKQKLYFEKIYAHLYSKGQPTPDNRIQVPIVINFMRSSGLPDTKLKEVWRLSSNGNEPISKPQLFNILRYITLAQNGYEIRQNLLGTSSQLGLPEFSELAFSPNDFDKPEHPPSLSTSNGDNHEQSFQTMISSLPTYKTQIGALLHMQPPFVVTNKNAVEFFTNFNMQTKDLSNVWNLCDTNAKGYINEPEIIVAFHIIRMFKMGRPLPLSLSKSFQQFIETYNNAQLQTNQAIQRSSTFGVFGGAKKIEGQISNTDITSPKTENEPNSLAFKNVQSSLPSVDLQPNPLPNIRPKVAAQQPQNMRSSNFFVNFPEPEKEPNFQQNHAKHLPQNQNNNALSDNAKTRLRTSTVDTHSEIDSIASPNLLKKPQPASTDENGHESIKLLYALLSQVEGVNNQNQSSNEQFYLQLSGLTTQKDDLVARVNQNMTDFFTLFNQLIQKMANLKSSLANLQIKSEAQAQILQIIQNLEVPDSLYSGVEALLESSQINATALKKLSPDDKAAPIHKKIGEVNPKAQSDGQKLIAEQKINEQTIISVQKETISQKVEEKQSNVEAPNFESQEQTTKENLFDPNFDFDTFGGNEKDDAKMFSDFGLEPDFKDPFSEDLANKKQFEDDFNF